LYTSFVYPVMLDDGDASMIEAVLRTCDLSSGVALMINSPGGLGLAAERIINVCRSYSGTKDYIAVVPNKAKSAATMICLGASEIMMGRTSELGPVDPQVTLKGGRYSVYNIVKSYEHLFEKAVKAQGNIQPYLLQLSHFDEKDITEYKTALDLSDDIAVKALNGGMLKGMSEEEIKKNSKN
jgi:ClpP class serine protease